jgi:flagellar motor switch protein FliM
MSDATQSVLAHDEPDAGLKARAAGGASLPHAVLSREEVEAVLAAVASGSADDPRSRRDVGATDAARFAWTPLARALRDYGDDTARSLSTLFQRKLTFSLIDLRSLPADDFAAAMLPSDAPLLLRFAPAGATGAVMLGRTLVYGWTTLRFGGDVDHAPLYLPDRRYSRIEQRQLQRAAEELLGQLARALEPVAKQSIEIGQALEPDMLAAEIAPRLWVASYEIAGFGELARLRVALPEALFVRGQDVRTARPPRAHAPERLHDMPLRLSAEVGSAELPLRGVRALRVGDVIPLRSSAPDGVLVRIEGRPKFLATRGQIGAQLALRITERL